MNFIGRDIVSIKDFSKEEVNHILKNAKPMVPIAEGKERSNLLQGRVLATLFFEPSTRTRLSFESAMKRLGGATVGFASPGVTSVKKGETLADTIRMADAYSDAIVMRHPQEGSARLAAEFADVPILNGGDGAGQHPTQTLLDLYTILAEKGRIEKNNVVLVGDLRYGRTVHSLSHALTMFGTDLTFVAPEQLQMPKEIINYVREKGIEPIITSDIQEAIPNADVLYVTRIQKERFPDPEEYRKVAGVYQINDDLLENAKKDMIIMHPLPRVNEIAPEVDATPHAKYFRQAFYGVPVRMALLAMVMGAIE